VSIYRGEAGKRTDSAEESRHFQEGKGSEKKRNPQEILLLCEEAVEFQKKKKRSPCRTSRGGVIYKEGGLSNKRKKGSVSQYSDSLKNLVIYFSSWKLSKRVELKLKASTLYHLGK